MLNTFCPGRGSNQDLFCDSQTLYRVAIKAGLYRKAVQVCIIPNITTYLPQLLPKTTTVSEKAFVVSSCYSHSQRRIRSNQSSFERKKNIIQEKKMSCLFPYMDK